MNSKKKEACIRQIIANIQKELNDLYLLLDEKNDDADIKKSKNTTNSSTKVASSSNSNKRLDEAQLAIIITDILHELHVPAHIKGYQYLREAIIECYKDENMAGDFTNNLYPKIAILYETTGSAVEKGIRNAIFISSQFITPESMKKYFGYVYSPQKGKPSNTRFIAALTDYIKLHM